MAAPVFNVNIASCTTTRIGRIHAKKKPRTGGEELKHTTHAKLDGARTSRGRKTESVCATSATDSDAPLTYPCVELHKNDTHYLRDRALYDLVIGTGIGCSSEQIDKNVGKYIVGMIIDHKNRNVTAKFCYKQARNLKISFKEPIIYDSHNVSSLFTNEQPTLGR